MIVPQHREIFNTWPSSAKPDELKGLRLIQAILKYRGTKRFRTKYYEEDDQAVFLSEQIDVGEAQTRLEKKKNTSVYTAEYGSKIKSKFSDQINILNYKKFSELPFNVMLTEGAKKSLDGWLALNDQDAYKASVLNTLRSLFSVIKVKAVAHSAYTDHYQYNRGLVVPNERIDKRLFTKTVVPQPSSSKPAAAPAPEPEPESHADKAQKAAQANASLLNPSAIRKELLKGNGYITASCFVPDKISNYQDTYKNPVGSKQVKKIDYDYFTSIATGGVCPEPLVLRNFSI